MHGLSLSQLNRFAFSISTALKFAIAVIVSIVLLALFTPIARAQTVPTVTFGASVTNAAGSLSTKLTWNCPGASGGTASGSPDWTGAKPASGSQDLPAITLSGTYTLSLSCDWPGVTQAVLTWTPPTQNTDGSALAKCASQTATGSCLKQFLVLHGTVSGQLSESKLVDDRNATGYTWTGLPAGSHFFAARALNGDGVQSDLSIEANKVTSGSVSKSASVTLTVNPKPNTVSSFGVQERHMAGPHLQHCTNPLPVRV